jgi:hypothetical protein
LHLYTLIAFCFIKLSVIISAALSLDGTREEGRLPAAMLRKVPSPSGPRMHASAQGENPGSGTETIPLRSNAMNSKERGHAHLNIPFSKAEQLQGFSKRMERRIPAGASRNRAQGQSRPVRVRRIAECRMSATEVLPLALNIKGLTLLTHILFENEEFSLNMQPQYFCI